MGPVKLAKRDLESAIESALKITEAAVEASRLASIQAITALTAAKLALDLVRARHSSLSSQIKK